MAPSFPSHGIKLPASVYVNSCIFFLYFFLFKRQKDEEEISVCAETPARIRKMCLASRGWNI